MSSFLRLVICRLIPSHTTSCTPLPNPSSPTPSLIPHTHLSHHFHVLTGGPMNQMGGQPMVGQMTGQMGGQPMMTQVSTPHNPIIHFYLSPFSFN